MLKEVCEALYPVLATYRRPGHIFTTTINRGRVETNKLRISRVMEHAPCDWSNRWQACSHGVPKQIPGHYITIKWDFSLRYYLLFGMQNISLFSWSQAICSTNDSSIYKNSELGRCFESYSLNIPSEYIADKNHFKDGEPFILPYCMIKDEIPLSRNKKWKTSYWSSCIQLST